MGKRALLHQNLNTTSNKNKISEVMLWIDISLMFKHNFVCLNTNLT